MGTVPKISFGICSADWGLKEQAASICAVLLQGSWAAMKDKIQSTKIQKFNQWHFCRKCLRQRLFCSSAQRLIAPGAQVSAKQAKHTVQGWDDLLGDVVDGVQVQAAPGFHQRTRLNHHVHQARTCAP